MRKSLMLLIVAFLLFPLTQSCEKAEAPAPATQSDVERDVSINKPIVLAYFPSWSETWTSVGKNSKMREIPSYVNTIFLAFAYPNMRYTKGSYDLKGTGLNFSYDGQTFRETARALKMKGIRIILSLGGETYWSDAYSGASAKCYDINYQQIKDFLDDFELAGIDWDYEPAGQISILSEKFHVNKFVEFITKSREIMPKGQYLIAAAPSGVGALGGPGPQPAGIDDKESPYSNAKSSKYGVMNSNAAKVGADAATLFGFASSGHFIPVMEKVGDKIDIIAYQGYNCGGANMAGRKVMYDAYAYYANKYGFTVAAGTHVANEPWGPYYIFDYGVVGELAEYIRGGGEQKREGKNDGIMLWEYLAVDNNASHVKKNTGIAFCALSAAVLNGKITAEEAKAYDPSQAVPEEYKGGAEISSGGGSGGSGGSDGGVSDGNGGTNTDKLHCGYPAWSESKAYETADTKVYYKGKIWKNAWWTQGEIPGTLWSAWSEVSDCAGSEEETDPKPPVTDPTPPVTDPTPPVTDPTPPVTDPTPPVTDPTPPVTDPTPPVTDPTPPVTDPTPPADTTKHCNHDAWNSTKVYSSPGTQVYYEGFIWKNNWWTQGDKPVSAPYGVPWTKVIECK